MVDTENPGTGVAGRAEPGPGKKLLDRAWDALLAAGFEQAAATRYVDWMRQYILYHGKRHPQEMGIAEIRQYLASRPFQQPGGQEQRVDAERAFKFVYNQVLRRLWPRDAASALSRGGSGVEAVKAGASSGHQAPEHRGPEVAARAPYRNGRDIAVPLRKRVRNALRVGQYALDTEKICGRWVERFVKFHQGRAAETMGAKEVEQFLTRLAVDRSISAKSQRQALSALVFLYGTVLGIDLGELMPVRGRRVPVVMTRREVPLVLGQVEGGGGCFRLMCELMYGAGLRIRECCRLRVKDVDFGAATTGRAQRQRRPGPGDGASGAAGRTAAPADRAGAAAARSGPRGGVRLRLAAASVAAQVPQCRAGIRLAVPVPGLSTEPGSAREGDPHEAPAPHSREFAAEGRAGGGETLGIDEANYATHVSAQLRNPPAGNGPQHQEGAGAARAQRYPHDDDLLARDGRRDDRGPQSAGYAGRVGGRDNANRPCPPAPATAARGGGRRGRRTGENGGGFVSAPTRAKARA